LDLPLRAASVGQHTCYAGRCSCPIEDGRIVGGSGRSKVGVIEKIEDLQAELYVESLRDPPDVIVFENGKVQVS